MKTRTLFILLVIVALTVAACGPATAPTAQVIKETVVVPVQQTVEVPIQQTVEVQITSAPQAVQVVRVSMGFIPDAQYAPWYVGIEKGFFAEEGIQLVLDYSNEADGAALVAAGTDDFGIGSGDIVIGARAKGLPLVMVARWYNGIPASLFSLKEKNITQPADLVGKTLGIPGAYGINYHCLLGTLAANNIDPKALTITTIGWTQIAAVTGGQVDAAAGYSNNEPVVLAASGAEVNVIELSQWCKVAPIGLSTSEDMIKNNPDLVQKMVRAMLRSVKATIDDPAFALDAVVRAVQYSGGQGRPVTQAKLAKNIEFWTTSGKYGLYTPEEWIATQDLLVTVGQIDKAAVIDVSKAYTNQFAENAQP